MLLNNIAYTLAEAKTGLDLAKEYAQKSIDELDDEADGSQSSREAGMRLTYQYALVWDTLGWVYFQEGDFKQAEKFVRASWLSVSTVLWESISERSTRDWETAKVPSIPTNWPWLPRLGRLRLCSPRQRTRLNSTKAGVIRSLRVTES